ncbi:hypothetical protein chiPu_0024726, partial [Chiloscyllium punctatum]|nr:hypothetical protein [Chiloscyllium punctatum]
PPDLTVGARVVPVEDGTLGSRTGTVRHSPLSLGAACTGTRERSGDGRQGQNAEDQGAGIRRTPR